MTTFDLSPLFRTSVGFDRLASLINISATGRIRPAATRRTIYPDRR